MKTLIIYNDIESLSFAIVDGDYSRFDGVCINSDKTGFESEFSEWFFNPETGEQIIKTHESTALIEDKNWDKVAICTFLP